MTDPGAPANVAGLLADTAARLPDKPALVFRDRAIAYSELDRRANLAAAAFAGLGVRPGDRVALLLGNVPEFVYAFYGALRAGAIAAPLNPLLTAEEVGYILADAGARVVVTETGTLPTVLAVRDRVAELEHVLVIGGPPTPRGTESFESLLERAGDPPDVSKAPGDVAVITYTSGTTASPKGAMLSHRNLLANLEQMGSVPLLAEAESDVALLVLPLFHIYALNVILGLTIKVGATAVLAERFEAAETLELVARHGVTILFGAPPMFYAWLSMPSGVTPDLSSVRVAVSGAARLPGEVLEGFRDRFGITIWEGYGLTETAPALTSNALAEEAKPNSIGLPLPGIELKIVDEEGEEVLEDDPGEIVVRGPNVFEGYWHRPEETERVLRDGWFHTGDIAYRDDDGYLFVVDRKKDLIIVSGFNVFPKEVEDALLGHPKVAEAAVVGVPDERTGEAVKATVVAAPGQSLTEDELLDHLHGRIARFKWPREIELASELPKLVTGKVLRRVLRGEDLLGDADATPADDPPGDAPAPS